MDTVTWAALTLTLTLLGAVWTWVSFQRRGLPSGLRALAFTLLPLAAYLTDTLRMFTRIADAVADWATGLVFSPTVWAGIVLAGLSGLLFFVSSALLSRAVAKAGGSPAAAPRGSTEGAALPRGAAPSSKSVVDDDLADIEAMLKKRGIS